MGWSCADSNGSAQNRNCLTGEETPLLPHLLEGLRHAKQVDLLVAFLMESGVNLLVENLKVAVNRGAGVRIVCVNYMNITQPAALYRLRYCLGDQVSLKFYSDSKKSFHPKAYFFTYDTHTDLFVGSSNLSKSALTDGLEWNYRLDSRDQPKDVQAFQLEFEDIYKTKTVEIDDVTLRRYSLLYRQPKRVSAFESTAVPEQEKTGGDNTLTDERSDANDTETSEETDENDNLTGEGRSRTSGKMAAAEKGKQETLPSTNPEGESYTVVSYPTPNGPQTEALYALLKTREAGNEKALVVAATGVGKTYLAAFDSLQHASVLFLAHREELLLQAERVFRIARPNDSTGFFMGENKQKEASLLFATVQTLGKSEYLNESVFPRGRFDYIVVDEFHHAAADSYRRILDWFQPRFLLGLTATPERMDNKDVFALCDYNVVYDVRLKEAIEKCWLAPFHYYGIDDETISYDAVPFRNGQYDEDVLQTLLSVPKRSELVLQHFARFPTKRCIGFCAGRMHAAYMADAFRKAGIAACAVMADKSGIIQDDVVMDRHQALIALKAGTMRVIFAVDMLNEGVDIPMVDMLLFLRPTESGTVFLQQLGRGLRIARGKKYVTVLDFIGNYRNVRTIPNLLTGNGPMGSNDRLPKDEDYPEGCRVQFDWKVVDLFHELERRHAGVSTTGLAKREYDRIRDYLDKKPSMAEFYEQMDDDIWTRIKG